MTEPEPPPSAQMTEPEPPPSESGQIVVTEPPEQLPLGWTELVESNGDQQIKFYYNCITRQKFYSKEDLLRYVELGSPSQGTRQRTRAQNEGNRENRLMLMPALTDKAPEWLPEGWICELNAVSSGRKYKTYIDPSTGRRFYSKPDILKYLDSDECNDPMAKQIATGIISASNVLPVVTGNTPETTPEWLPEGWIMEVNKRGGGRNVKRYIDPLTGLKFYSKPEVMAYLNSGIHRRDKSGQTAARRVEGSESVKGSSSMPSPKQICSGSSRQKNVEVVRYEADGLPPGWIKEIKFERTGNKIRKDPFYTDPDTRYVFRSSRDALRYLEAKDIKACIMRPKKREELDFLTNDIPLLKIAKICTNSGFEFNCQNYINSSISLDDMVFGSPNAQISEERQTLLLDDSTMEKCNEKEENHGPTVGQLPIAPGSKRKRGRPVAAPSPNNILQQEKPAEVSIDSTRSSSVQVITEQEMPAEFSINSTRSSSVQVVAEEAGTMDNGTKGEDQNLEQPIKRLGGDSTTSYPCLEFAFKTLRGDIPVEANNLAAQGYNHQQRASVNVGLPSFSDYARQQR